MSNVHLSPTMARRSPSPSIVYASDSTPPKRGALYHPVYHHWFYQMDMERNWFRKESNVKYVWKPFSMADSLALEQAISSPSLNEETLVQTDGSRYDVNIMKRQRIAVYWDEKPNIVRRCSWFYKDPIDNHFVPYEEDISAILEEEYRQGMVTGLWGRRVMMGAEEVIMKNATMIIQQKYSTDVNLDTSAPSQPQAKTVKRGGFDEFDISDGEPTTVDHLIFLVHGIGQFCDLRFRSIVEVVDESRSIALKLTQSHFQESTESGFVNRIEMLPVSWHKALHSENTGIDRMLKNITLPSVPKLRDFANDTVLDILFYTSPVFCQVIIDAVALEMNRLYHLFTKRNPTFSGKTSVSGHSLGSLILFDLLSNQPTKGNERDRKDNDDECEDEVPYNVGRFTRRVSYVTPGNVGIGQPYVKYPHLHFKPRFFFAFGSPIACFIATRGVNMLGEDFKFPTCAGFFNIFHPYDPIAYRIEPLIIPSLSNVKPVQITHHKGRKRMHLEFKDTVSNVGQRLVDTVKSTWNTFYHLTVSKQMHLSEPSLQQDITRVLQTQTLGLMPTNPNLTPVEPTSESTDVKVGNLNEGRRVDYVLQEAPVEYFNEYIFALASHLCYWTSRDVMLLLLKEIYNDVGVSADNQISHTNLSYDLNDLDIQLDDPEIMNNIDDNSNSIIQLPQNE